MIQGIKSKKRTTENGEILTPEFIVDAMLDQFPDIIDPSKNVLEPSCGEGIYLTRLYKRRIASGADPFKSLQTLYGVDIDKENVNKTRQELAHIYLSATSSTSSPASKDELIEVLSKNFIVADFLSLAKTPKTKTPTNKQSARQMSFFGDAPLTPHTSTQSNSIPVIEDIDYYIGNPPYNTSNVKGLVSANNAVYEDFVRIGFRAKVSSLIIPLRFLVHTQNTSLAELKDYFLDPNNTKITSLTLFANHSPFPRQVQISGGVFFYIHDNLNPLKPNEMPLITEYLFDPQVKLRQKPPSTFRYAQKPDFQTRRFLKNQNIPLFVKYGECLPVLEKIFIKQQELQIPNLSTLFNKPLIEFNTLTAVFYNEAVFKDPELSPPCIYEFPHNTLDVYKLLEEPKALAPATLTPSFSSSSFRLLGRIKEKAVKGYFELTEDWIRNVYPQFAEKILYRVNQTRWNEMTTVFESLLNKTNSNNGYKVFTSRLLGFGNQTLTTPNTPSRVMPQPILGFPQDLCTASYFMSNSFETYEEAFNLYTYLQTKIFRFILFNQISGVHLHPEYNFASIPAYSQPNQTPSTPFIPNDEYLKDLYELTEEEYKLICRYVIDYSKQPISLSPKKREEDEKLNSVKQMSFFA